MPYFSYKAIDSNGEISRGVAVGEHMDDAYNSVTASGLYVLDISRSNPMSNFLFNKFRGGGVERKDVIEFASNLSVMLKAGLSILESLEDIAESIENKRFKARVLDIKSSIEFGSSFSDAIARHSDVFPDIFIRLIGAGEETGRFAESLADILVHLKRIEDMRRVIVRSLIYPAFALAATTGALIFWLIYVLPRLKDLFDTLGTELPPITKGLIAASAFTTQYWYLFTLMPAVIYIILKVLSQNSRTGYYIDAVKLKIPIVGLLLYNKLLALFAEQLRILVAAGVTIDRSFDIIINIMDNRVFKRALRSAKEEIMFGSSISDALKKHGDLFPPLSIRMISVGETTGRLPEQLDHLSRTFIETLEDISEKMGKMIEPIIILVIGSMFLIIILGLLAPIFDLITAVG